ncbi:hypothetical protein [Pedobacter antarcticus]|uniref:hypothetical protein n=1 Tax=Pedobacter antarcticus TaxID=34086 RepID=UPI00292E06DC|nr:hypothetical protein [Pedobacter antarcticus]
MSSIWQSQYSVEVIKFESEVLDCQIKLAGAHQESGRVWDTVDVKDAGPLLLLIQGSTGMSLWQ